MYHGVVSTGSGPAIHKTANVPVDGVHIVRCSVDVVHEACYCLALRRLTVDSYLSGVPHIIAVGVVTGQINQEIGLVPFLQSLQRKFYVL